MTKAYFQDEIRAAIPKLIGQLDNGSSLSVLVELARYGKTRLVTVVMGLMNT